MNDSENKKTPREVAEAIAKAHGTKPEVITVEMVGTEEVECFIKLLKDAQENAHKGPPLHIGAAA